MRVTPLTEILSRVEVGPDVDRHRVPDDWGQGRTTFGGLIAAVALGALRRRHGEGRAARTLLASFVAPVVPGEIEVRTRCLRQGRSVGHVEARVEQQGEVCLSMIGSFVDGRPGGLTVPAGPPPEMASPESLPELPFVDGLTPAFFRHYDLRIATGGPPFSGLSTRTLAGWCRYRGTCDGVEQEGRVALLDAWPPAVLQMLSTPSRSSTLHWTVELTDAVADEPDAWWAYRADVDAYRDGYAHTRASLWTADGRLVARGHQTVSVFEPS